MDKQYVSRHIGPKRGYMKYREFLRAKTSDRLCVCIQKGRVKLCNENEDRRPCIHKACEVTDIFNKWLDGDITKQELVSALSEKDENICTT